MKGPIAIALLAIAVGAIMHFWPRPVEQPRGAPSASGNASYSTAPVAPGGSPTSAQQSPTTSAPSPERAAQAGTVERLPVKAVQIEIRAPDTVRSGDAFPVTIDVQALRGIRHLAFSVTYKKSILQLIGSSPGAFAQQGGASAQIFEESSDGYLLVRIDLESGVIAGTGSVAVLEFQALKRGVSPLSVHGVTYVEGGREDTAITTEDHEGSIAVY
jgi:hypothetical protein